MTRMIPSRIAAVLAIAPWAVLSLMLTLCTHVAWAESDPSADDGDGEVGDTQVEDSGITKTSPFHDELDLTTSMLTAEVGNCFLTTIRVGGIEACVIGKFPFAIPMVCVRMHNNYPSNIVESSAQYMHFSSQTLVAEESAKIAYGLVKKSRPANLLTRMLGRSGNSSSGIYRVHSRTQWPPLTLDVIPLAMDGALAGTLCLPAGLLTPHQGYIYASDLDRTWNHKLVSPYWTFPLTAEPTIASKTAEQFGLCGADIHNLLCYGGWCSLYPATGRVTTTSPALALLCGMWRAQEITNGSFAYGLNSRGLGPGVLPLHDPLSYAFSVPPVLAGGPPKYGRNSYVQWLFPGSTSLGASDTVCHPLGIKGPGTIPILGATMVTELTNESKAVPTPDNTLALMYWPRFTCCTACIPSLKAPARLLTSPERSYIPALSTKAP